MRVKYFLHSVLAIATIVMMFSSCFHPDNKINATCFDEVLNQDEEFVDCGGPNCEECPPACDNGILDWEEGWQEVGVDCGGPCETCCENERWDVNPNDPTLSEVWIDCGGPECPPCDPCANGEHNPGEEFLNPVTGLIEEAIDCDDDPDTDCPPCNELCNDGLYNGLEEDCADCGGVCAPCDNNHCTNQVLDEFNPEGTTTIQSETEIDCGGCMCLPCTDEFFCSDGYISGFEGTTDDPAIDCGGGVCVPCNDISLCTDGYLNGYETEIDCYDGTDGLSACPPCNATCESLALDGLETDTDCGGEFCFPCATEDMFMTYTVTTSNGDETDVFYESSIGSLGGILTKGIFDPGAMPLPIDIEDQLTFGGGSAHQFVFNLEDDDNNPGFFNKDDEFYLNFIAITVSSPDNVAFDSNVGDLIYESRYSSEGITLDDFELDGPTPVPGPPNTFEITVAGTFSGTVKVADSDPVDPGAEAFISNGEFRITWQQIILP